MSLNMEDIYELVEQLPQDIRDRFTNLRELDLSVENNVDKATTLQKGFFASADKMNQSERKTAHEGIMRHYNKAREDADEKVQIATGAQNMLQSLMKVLDTNIEIAKRDLNKEIPGSAEKIEQQSLEADRPSTSSSQKENRYNLNSSRSHDKHSHTKKNNSKPKHLSRKEKKRRDSNASSTSVERRVVSTSSSSLQEPRPASANSGPLVAQQQTSSLSGSISAPSSVGPVNPVVPVNCNLGHIGPGGNAIAAAASQAIAATQQMQQGRRTASLKASYEAINTGGGVHAAEFSRELAGAAQTAIAAIQESSKKIKKKVSSANVASTSVTPASVQQQQVQQQTIHQQQSHQQQLYQQQSAVAAAAAAVASAPSHQIGAAGSPANVAAAAAVVHTNAVADVDSHEWTYDPNEPRYCICNQISYGEMVACDNLECPVEWFHYPCVNITAPPKGKWYCPQCTTAMKKRGGRKN